MRSLPSDVLLERGKYERTITLLIEYQKNKMISKNILIYV